MGGELARGRGRGRRGPTGSPPRAASGLWGASPGVSRWCRGVGGGGLGLRAAPPPTPLPRAPAAPASPRRDGRLSPWPRRARGRAPGMRAPAATRGTPRRRSPLRAFPRAAAAAALRAPGPSGWRSSGWGGAAGRPSPVGDVSWPCGGRVGAERSGAARAGAVGVAWWGKGPRRSPRGGRRVPPDPPASRPTAAAAAAAAPSPLLPGTTMPPAWARRRARLPLSPPPARPVPRRRLVLPSRPVRLPSSFRPAGRPPARPNPVFGRPWAGGVG